MLCLVISSLLITRHFKCDEAFFWGFSLCFFFGSVFETGLVDDFFVEGDDRKDAQVNGEDVFPADCAFFTASFATLSTIQSKLSLPTA